jgi:hypothetical protein
LQEKNTRQDTSQISGQSVQAKHVNINATDDMFLAFTVVQWIMTELSGVATGKEKVVVTTKPAYRLETLKCSLPLFMYIHRDCGVTQTSQSYWALEITPSWQVI